jgi:hypothetical protein
VSIRARRAGLVLLVAIAGLALAVALAVLTSRLTTQHVGLAGEPPRPATGLVAPPRTRPAQTAPATIAPAQSDDAGEREDD